jgi:hypothetical protein
METARRGDRTMSKYQPLSDHLSGHGPDEWRASFGELEALLGFSLPKGARAGRTWWAADRDKSHVRAWTSHGWEVGDIDHAAERVVFRRGAASGAALAGAAGPQRPGEPPPAEPTRPAEASPEPAPAAPPAAAAAVAEPAPGGEVQSVPPAAVTATAAPLFAFIGAGVAVSAAVLTFMMRTMLRRR